MPTPAYVQAGSIAVANSSQTTLSVPYPASGVNAKDLILLAVVYEKFDGSGPGFTIPPTGFTTLGSGSANAVRKYLFYLTGGAVGTEGGTSITLNNGASLGGGAGAWSAQITQWTNVNATGSSFFEGFNTTEGAAVAVAGHSITTTGANELGVHYVVYTDGNGNALAVPSSWSGVFDEHNSTSGNSGVSGQHLDTISIPSATTITAPTSNVNGTGVHYASFDFALIPGQVNVSFSDTLSLSESYAGNTSVSAGLTDTLTPSESLSGPLTISASLSDLNEALDSWTAHAFRLTWYLSFANVVPAPFGEGPGSPGVLGSGFQYTEIDVGD